MLNQVHQGDCLEVMKAIPDGSVDLVLCDLPYGTTDLRWDSVIPLEELWPHYRRVLKKGGAAVLTASQPFSSQLVLSNLEWFRYANVWEKSRACGHANAKVKPLNAHEDILVFSDAKTAWNAKSKMTYNPQGLQPCGKQRSFHAFGEGERLKQGRKRVLQEYLQENTGYPRSIIRIPSEGKTVHPTQKPVALFEYLIRTYTNPGETVLDNCLGSGTTALAAINTGRNWIGIEREPKYVEIAQKRINEHLARLNGGLFA